MRVLFYAFSFLLLVSCSQETMSNKVKEKTEGQPTEEVSKEENNEKQEEMEEGAAENENNDVEKVYALNEQNWKVEPIHPKEANENTVLLTIDDAPDKYALQMAETLKAMETPAIFFVNGHFIESEEEKQTLKKIYDLGFEIGNHTMTHRDLKKLSKEEQYNEIVALNDLIEEVIGVRPQFFRAPFGSNTEYSREIALQEKMIVMNWTYGYDWEKEYQDKDAIADIMVNSPYLNNGANLLMHDREWTYEALPEIVNGIKDKGYSYIDPKQVKTIE